MAAKIVPFPNAATPSPDIELSLGRDDFSVQVKTPNDGRFWVRLEEQFGKWIATDFNMGNQSELDLARALHMALLEAAPQGVEQITFSNLVAGADPGPSSAMKLEQQTQMIKSVSKIVANMMGVEASDPDIDYVRGKFNALVVFSS